MVSALLIFPFLLCASWKGMERGYLKKHITFMLTQASPLLHPLRPACPQLRHAAALLLGPTSNMKSDCWLETKGPSRTDCSLSPRLPPFLRR